MAWKTKAWVYVHCLFCVYVYGRGFIREKDRVYNFINVLYECIYVFCVKNKQENNIALEHTDILHKEN